MVRPVEERETLARMHRCASAGVQSSERDRLVICTECKKRMRPRVASGVELPIKVSAQVKVALAAAIEGDHHGGTVSELVRGILNHYDWDKVKSMGANLVDPKWVYVTVTAETIDKMTAHSDELRANKKERQWNARAATVARMAIYEWLEEDQTNS